uniref:Uncharacterized protein n=1 Tax=Rhizophora mucronata TaxID=61149 RepID=A0A2P2Q372_RHIMU
MNPIILSPIYHPPGQNNQG